MVDIQPRQVLDEEFTTGRPWLLHVERKDNESVTLDVAAFLAADAELRVTSGTQTYIRSGVAVSINGSGLGVPTPAGGVVRGHLFTDEPVRTGQTRASQAIACRATVAEDAVPGGIPEDATRPSTVRYV